MPPEPVFTGNPIQMCRTVLLLHLLLGLRPLPRRMVNIYRSLQKPTRLPNPTLFEHVVTCGKRRDKEFCSSQCSVLNVPLSQSLSQLLLVENDSMGLHRREYPLLCSLLKRTKRICCGGFCSREKASPAVQWYLQLTSVVSHE